MGSIRDSRYIGRRVRDRRKSLGMTQESLAELVGVSYQQVQKYEKGLSRLSPERLQQVATALGTPITYFFREDDGTKVGGIGARTTCQLGPRGTLSREEHRFLKMFRRLASPTHRALVMSLLRALTQRAARSG